ncbi:hypothetical protein [Pontibacillus marinus]|uniref:Uncharacterized protein n=1 Tax=Pontibacillus marinus BH030004 = DSM 16465 TaxID=1385511 RepID=A0A0A5FTR8_9BACI|nr:hypothetical protein [Pontibacillus marinus]KGX84166.1 hypothetical protein N783_18950 [Pontibacillus marinus BH030004 = DSM 16465]
MERYIKLLIALIVSALLMFISNHFGRYGLDYIPFGDVIANIIYEIVYIIGFIAFVKVAYLWVKELWELK